MITLNQFHSLMTLFPQVKRFWIAYSGGLDSHVLLHVMSTLLKSEQRYTLHAVHINHHLSPNAHKWDEHCAAVCKSLNIPYQSHQVDVKAEVGQSLEAIARQKRYEIFNDIMDPQDCLLTAHHQDDQAETVLLQLLRGAGPKGLSGMPSFGRLSKGFHWRPLLKYTRANLFSYAEAHNLSWIDDESNFDTQIARNYLRHDVMPLLKEQWPALSKTLSRSAEHCAEAMTFLDELACQDLQILAGKLPNTLSISALCKLNAARQKNVIRYWLQQLALPLPSDIKLQHVCSDILRSRSDAMPLVKWSGVEMRRHRNALYAMPPLEKISESIEIPWNDLQHPLPLPGSLGSLQATPHAKGIVFPTNAHLTIRFRQGGERCHLATSQGSRSLKKLFQEWDVPSWQRNRIPLLYCNDQLACVVGYCVCRDFIASSNEKSWKIYLDANNACAFSKSSGVSIDND